MVEESHYKAQSSAQLAVGGRSNVGKVREDNQDAIQIYRPDEHNTEDFGFLYGIADGMGGYEHGGVASTLALRTLFETYYSSRAGQPAQNLKYGVQNANVSVLQMGQRMNARMGTTLTAVAVVGSRLHIAHVGDSRSYLIRNNKATPLTTDHTMVGELVRMKLLAPDKVRGHAQRSVLNRSLGIELFVQPEITQVELKHGDRVILCTDGVWSVIEDHEFARLAAKHHDVDELSESLLAMALDNDTDDNVSVVSIRIDRLPAEPAAMEAPRGLNLVRLFRGRAT